MRSWKKGYNKNALEKNEKRKKPFIFLFYCDKRIFLSQFLVSGTFIDKEIEMFLRKLQGRQKNNRSLSTNPKK